MFNDLLVELERIGFEVFAYADDLAIVGFEEFRLRKCIEITERWADKNNMRINKKKSGVIFHMKRGRKDIPSTEKKFGYPVKKEYKYLGIYMD